MKEEEEAAEEDLRANSEEEEGGVCTGMRTKSSSFSFQEKKLVDFFRAHPTFYDKASPGFAKQTFHMFTTEI